MTPVLRARSALHAFFLALIVLSSLAVGATGTAAQGTAVPRLRIGVDPNPKTSSDYRQGARAEAIRLAVTTGATQAYFSENWSRLEPLAGVFDLADARVNLELSAPTSLAFTLKVIDAGARQMPAAYQTLAWDSPEMVQRLLRMIESMAPLLGARPWSYAIGNEIDLYFSSRPAEIAPFARLLQQVAPRVRALHPNASLTTVWQFSSLPLLRTVYAPVLATVDHVAVTYYPLNGDFSVRPPASIHADLQVALAAAQPRPIAFQEIGYPTAALLGSSPEQQRAFMQQAFEAIRAAGTSRVLGATYLFQADLPEWLVSDLVRAYGLDHPNFRAFLSSLGLRDERDRPKPGWDEFLRQVDIVRPKRREP